MNLPPDFKELLEEFAREGVEHVVIGGYAFAFHVEPRATKDLDLLIEGSDEDRARDARPRHSMKSDEKAAGRLRLSCPGSRKRDGRLCETVSASRVSEAKPAVEDSGRRTSLAQT